MINLILIAVKSFFTCNKSYLLIGIACVSAIFCAYSIGFNQGNLTANQAHLMEQQRQAKEVLSQLIDNSKINLKKANQVSNTLSQQLVERKLNHDQSTRKLQNTLNVNADNRDSCLFDDNVLQLIDSARESAVTATTFGITTQPKRAVRGARGAP